MVERTPTPSDMEAAKRRREEFVLSIPSATLEAEDKLPAQVRSMNASPRSKLHRIYQVATELSEVRAPFVACRKGCASCCHMNVSLTHVEAERLGAAIGRQPATIKRSTRHALDTFAGVPCPFLDVGGSCSVYAYRPLACRKHASFFETSSPCHPSVMNELEVPKIDFSGLDEALFLVSKGGEAPILADIRDFFPPR